MTRLHSLLMNCPRKLQTLQPTMKIFQMEINSVSESSTASNQTNLVSTISLLLLLLFVKGKKAEPVIPYRLQKLTVSMYNISLLSM